MKSLNKPDSAISDKTNSKNLKKLFFVLGMVSAFSFNLYNIGQLFIFDLLTIFLPLFFLNSNMQFRHLQKEGRAVIFLGISWLIGLVISGLVNNASFFLIFKSALAIFIMISMLYFFLRLEAYLTKSFLLGLSFSVIVSNLVFTTFDLTISTFWKFGLGLSVSTIFLLVIKPNKNKGTLVYTFMFILALVSLGLNSRSLSYVFFITGMFVLFSSKNRASAASNTTATVLFRVLMVIILTFSYVQVYAFLANSNFLGDEIKSKYESQSSSELPLLLSGRNEIIYTWFQIKENPIIGSGPYPTISSGVLESTGSVFEQNGLSLRGLRAKMPLESKLPIHSFILGAWVTSGLIGLVFWTYVLYVAGKLMFVILRTGRFTLNLSLAVLLTNYLIWEILFSPFGGLKRLLTATTIALAIDYLRGARVEQR